MLITITLKLSQNTHHYKSTHKTHVQSFIMIITIMISIVALSSSFYCVPGTFGHYPHISLESITQNIHNFNTPPKTNTYQIYYIYMIYVILDTQRNSGLENGDSFQICQMETFPTHKPTRELPAEISSFLFVDDSCGVCYGTKSTAYLPSRGLTYPTLGKGKSSSKCHFWGIC